MELSAYQKAMIKYCHEEDKIKQACQQQLERLRYRAQPAEHQYNRADPDNYLTAAELEQRWENTL